MTTDLCRTRISSIFCEHESLQIFTNEAGEIFLPTRIVTKKERFYGASEIGVAEDYISLFDRASPDGCAEHEVSPTSSS